MTTGWTKEYQLNKSDYLQLFDDVMQREQETNIEFLEKSLSEKVGRTGVACAQGPDALYLSVLRFGIGKGDEVLTTNFL